MPVGSAQPDGYEREQGRVTGPLEKSLLRMGRVGGAYGIKGWLKIQSFTRPPENLLSYLPWQFCDPTERQPPVAVTVLESKVHGKGLIARLPDSHDRDAAERWRGFDIMVPRSCLPAPEAGHYYWADLEGLKVEQLNGQVLGQLDHLLETGSADVMVIVGANPGERWLVPFVPGETVHAVDLDAGIVRIDWEIEAA